MKVHYNDNYTFKIKATSLREQWVMAFDPAESPDCDILVISAYSAADPLYNLIQAQ